MTRLHNTARSQKNQCYLPRNILLLRINFRINLAILNLCSKIPFNVLYIIFFTNEYDHVLCTLFRAQKKLTYQLELKQNVYQSELYLSSLIVEK